MTRRNPLALSDSKDTRPEFVVRMLGRRMNEPFEFLGTGMLVAPEWVLTCRHVVMELDPYGHASNEPVRDLCVQTSSGNQSVSACPPQFAPGSDLALVKLSAPLDEVTAQFLAQITSRVEQRFKESSPSVFGYTTTEHRGCLWRYPVTGATASYRTDTKTMTQLQLSGGIPSGCSGGPLLLHLNDRWCYAGTVYLGGEHSATSRVIMADEVSEFLRHLGLILPASVDAEMALPQPTVQRRKQRWMVATVTIAMVVSALVMAATYYLQSRPEAYRAVLADMSLKFTSDAFTKALEQEDLDTATLFLKGGMNPDMPIDELESTSLFFAAKHGRISPMEFLLEGGANVNARNKKGATALSWAAANGQIGAVNLLLDKGVDAEAINEAFVYVATVGNQKLLEILLGAGADVQSVGSKALFGAAGSRRADSEIVRFLLDLGIDPNLYDDNGWTTLLMATSVGTARRSRTCASGRADRSDAMSKLETLLDGGADVNARMKGDSVYGFIGRNITPLMIAVSKQDCALVELLLARNADPTLENNRGETVLSMARDADMIALLKAAAHRKGVELSRGTGAAKITGSVLSDNDIEALVVRHDFFDKQLNPSGKGVSNQFEVRIVEDTVVVVDHQTGLMWQQLGSEAMPLQDADAYINQLNDQEFAGFNDWRIPSLVEAWSLMEPEAPDQMHFDQVFGRSNFVIWTADWGADGRAFLLYFGDGAYGQEEPGYFASVRAVRSETPIDTGTGPSSLNR